MRFKSEPEKFSQYSFTVASLLDDSVSQQDFIALCGFFLFNKMSEFYKRVSDCCFLLVLR
ncbi:MAG: hypothetical protein J7K22_02135 [Nanoarchaeota archaeon]|nr:hypothetical protein [Nanoarchaeota archaeon]